jgi:hypothetical protein
MNEAPPVLKKTGKRAKGCTPRIELPQKYGNSEKSPVGYVDMPQFGKYILTMNRLWPMMVAC